MKWEDSVMNPDRLNTILHQYQEGDESHLIEAIAMNQAELSFKAGRESWLLESKPSSEPLDNPTELSVSDIWDKGYKAGYLEGHNKGWNDGVKAGIREVVEWVEVNIPKTLGNYVGFYQQWQAKLEAWGIK